VIDGPDLGRSTVANSNGEYRFDGLRVADMNFRASASGFGDDRRGTFVNGTNTLNFTLTPANATLRGTVRSSAGQMRLENATIEIVNGPSAGRTTTTGSTGEYRFDSLAPGNTTVQARASNHSDSRRDITLSGSGDNQLDFELTSEAPALSIVVSQIAADATGAEFGFEARGSFGPSRFSWDFGDGAGVDNGGQREQHRYTVQSDFTVRVRVTPLEGGTPLTASTVITVRFGFRPQF
jgi:hypothetical protein